MGRLIPSKRIWDPLPQERDNSHNHDLLVSIIILMLPNYDLRTKLLSFIKKNNN